VTAGKLHVVAPDGTPQGAWDAGARQVQTFTYDDKSIVLSGPGHDDSVIILNWEWRHGWRVYVSTYAIRNGSLHSADCVLLAAAALIVGPGARFTRIARLAGS